MKPSAAITIFVAVFASACLEVPDARDEPAEILRNGKGPGPRDNVDATSPAIDAGAADLVVEPDSAIGVDSNVDDPPAPPPQPGTKAKDVWDQIIPAGFVTSADVGLPAGWSPKQVIVGDLSTTKDGQVIEDLQIEGMLRVDHDDVVVRRNRIFGGKFHVVAVTGARALIEDNELGQEVDEALLTKAVVAGSGDTIEVNVAVPVDATVYLSASTPFQEQFIVVGRTGSGPYTLKLEHRQSDADIRSPANPRADHPKGDTIAWYHAPSHGPLPGNGVSGGAPDYTVRRNLIQCVNDGIKQIDGLAEDNLIRLQFFVPPAHLDGIQTLRGVNGRVLHNTIIRSQDSNAVLQASEGQGPIIGFQWKWNLHVGGQYHSVRWYGTSADFHWNRWFKVGFSAFLHDGSGLTTRDLRYIDGTLIETKGFDGGPDSEGNGSGAGDAWGDGYAQDPDWKDHFALPQNPEF